MTNTSTELSSTNCLSENEKRLFRAIDDEAADELEQAISAIGKPSLATTERLNRALLFAVQCGALDACKRLVSKGANIEARDPVLWRTPLILAGDLGFVSIVAFLLESGADVHAEDDFRNTALCVAADLGTAKLVDLLIQYGAHLEHQNDLKWTPLITASASGNIETFHALTKQGAYLDARAVLGWTPLMVAAQTGQTEVMCRLLELGADSDIADNFGRAVSSVSPHSEADIKILGPNDELARVMTTQSSA